MPEPEHGSVAFGNGKIGRIRSGVFPTGGDGSHGNPAYEIYETVLGDRRDGGSWHALSTNLDDMSRCGLIWRSRAASIRERHCKTLVKPFGMATNGRTRPTGFRTEGFGAIIRMGPFPSPRGGRESPPCWRKNDRLRRS